MFRRRKEQGFMENIGVTLVERLNEYCIVEFGGVRVFRGTLRECMGEAFKQGFTDDVIDIISEKTGEVMDVEWDVHVKFFVTRRTIDDEVIL